MQMQMSKQMRQQQIKNPDDDGQSLVWSVWSDGHSWCCLDGREKKSHPAPDLTT